MQLERPRFRQDLVAELVEDGNHRFVDLMDPDSGNVYRFYEVEYSLACAMDGERDVPGIVRWAQEELGLQANPNEIKSVIATLGDLGYLDGGAPAARPETPAHKPAGMIDEELGRGVVVGSKRVNTPVPGLELGHAGASAAPPARAEAPVADVELAAGVTTGRSAQPQRAKVEDIALGTPGRADVSLDLADQVGISANDVKEAVRASKVMNAVEVPADLQNALDSAEAPVKQKKPPPTPAKGTPAVDTKVEDKAAAAAKAAEAAKAEAAKAEAAKKAAEAEKAAAAAKAEAAKAAKPLPKQVEKQKQPEAKAAVAPPAPAPTVSRGLLVVLAIVALGAIAFLVYKFVLAKHTDETSETVTPKPQPPPPQPPPPPPVESEKLATNAPQSESIKPTAAGTIEMIAANDAKVKEGDTLARFTGAKALATEIAALDKDIEQRVKTELFKAQQERDAAIAADNKAAQTAAEAKVADRQKSLDDKQAKLSTKKADLDKLEIKSPADGTFTAKAKAGTKVTPTDEIGMLVRAPTRTVTFKKADGAPKSKVILVTKDNQKLACIVTSVDSAGVAIACPEDAAPEGTEVTFGGIDNTPPPVSPEQNGSGASTGSAGTTGATTGSGAGSAAPAAVPSPAPTRPAPPARPAPARPTPKAPKPAIDKGSAETAPADKGSSEATPPAAGSDTPAP